MVGELGTALTAFSPGAPGQVALHGEIWRGYSDTAVAAGARVRVRAISGLSLEIEPVAVPPPQEADHVV
jgi:membrane protein implicated in regulation of membrane protease activity